jgi:hypothetical protein
MDRTDVTDAGCERHISPTTERARAIERLAHSIARVRPFSSDELDATGHGAARAAAVKYGIEMIARRHQIQPPAGPPQA